MISDDEDIEVEKQKLWNQNRPQAQSYSENTIDALNMRYEAPIAKNRWDSPLFRIITGEGTDLAGQFDAIVKALCSGKGPKPNRSTQSQPLTSDGQVQKWEAITKAVSDRVLKLGKSKDLTFTNAQGELETTELPDGFIFTEARLADARRQFLSFSKQRRVDDKMVESMFVRFLKSQVVGDGPGLAENW